MERAVAAWHTGPAGDRRRFAVARPEPIPGGQGYVFRAVDRDGRDVALKQIGPVDAEREAKIAARLEALRAAPHPRLAAPVSVFRGPGLFRGDPPPDDESDLLYVAAPWVEGEPLRSSSPLSPEAAARLAEEVADAVVHLHDRCGLLHRDLHPGNVILGPDGGATVIDFGTVRPDDGVDTTTVAGSLGFIAPELTYDAGGRAADRWAVGMLVVHALLGHPQGSQPEGVLRDELLGALAGTGDPRRAAALIGAMVARDPDDRPEDLRAWAAELRTLIERPPSRPGRWLAAAGVVATVALVAGILVVARRGDPPDDPAAGPPPPADEAADGGEGAVVGTTVADDEPAVGGGLPCVWEPGRGLASTNAEDQARVKAAEPELARLAGGGCALGPAETFVEAVFQTMDTEDGRGVAVAVVSPAGSVLVSPAQWQSYREIAGRDRPQNAVDFGGYPAEVESDALGGLEVVRLSLGGVLVGRRADTQSFWMPGPGLELWESLGGLDGELGAPMTNPYLTGDIVRQDFERGLMEAPTSVVADPGSGDPSILTWQRVEDREAPLRDLGDLEGRLLRQPTGTVWLVVEGERRWVPDGGTYDCLGGDLAVARDGVPGWAVATLPLGPPASCDDA